MWQLCVSTLAYLRNNCILLAAYTQDRGVRLSPEPLPREGNRLCVNVPNLALIAAFLIFIFPSMLFAVLIVAANSSFKKSYLECISMEYYFRMRSLVMILLVCYQKYPLPGFTLDF